MESSLLVFLSSTSDMQAEYQELEKSLPRSLRLYWFELDRARRATPEDRCKAQIAQCDVFVIALGEKYGSVFPGAAKSFVEWEFENASVRADLEILPFVKESKARDQAQQKLIDRVTAFRTGMWSKFFNTPEEFARAASKSLMEWLAEFRTALHAPALVLARKSRSISLAAAFCCLAVMAVLSVLAILGRLTTAAVVACDLTLACGVAMALVMYMRNFEPPDHGRKT